MSLTVSGKIGTSGIYGNVVARSQFTPQQQAIMDGGGNYAGYAVVNGHFTYVGAGRTGQDAYNAVFPSATPAAPAQAPAGVTQPTYSNQPAKGSWMNPGELFQGRTTFPDGSSTSTPRPLDADKSAQDRANQNAYEFLVRKFREWGLEGLGPQIMDWLVKGYDSDTISLMIQDTPEYKQRFKGNETRKANGLRVLNPDEYLSVESAYAQVLRAAGLPPGFYDDPKTDFADWIGKDVAPTEVKARADMAIDRVNDSNPETLQALSAYYGITPGDLAAYFLDQKRALPLLEKQARAADIGAAARHQGLALTDQSAAERYASQGVTKDQANEAYGNIALLLPTEQQIAGRFHDTYGQADAEEELLGGLASARRKRERLNQMEQGLFGGSSGVGSGSLKTGATGSY